MIFQKLQAMIIKFFQKKLRKRLSKIHNIQKLKKLTSKLTKKRLQLIQRINLYESIQYAIKNSPFYNNHLKDYRNEIDYKNSLKKLETLPFTTAEDLSTHPDKFLAIPQKEIAAYHFSAGTTGERKKIFLSKKDLELIRYSYKLGFINSELSTDDVAQIMYSFGIWQLGALFQEALANLDIVCLPTGNFLKPEEQKEYIENFNVTVITGTPSYLCWLAREINLSEKAKKNMKKILVGGEGLSKIRRDYLESQFGGEVFVGYGLMEFGGGIADECRRHNGYHLYPGVVAEIIDPKTGETLEDGKFGELVLTSLYREAMPLIRYRTGDITRIIDDKCDCGLNIPRIDYIKGRVDERITIGTAEKYYPIVFEKIFQEYPQILDYWIEIREKNNKDALTINVVTKKPSEELGDELIQNILLIPTIKTDYEKTNTIKKPTIIFVEEPRQNVKAKRIIDHREE